MLYSVLRITSDWRVFECVDAKEVTYNRKTSYWSNMIFPYMEDRQRYPRVRVRVFNNFVINVDIEPPSRLPSFR